MDDVAIGARASEELLAELAGLLGEPFLALRLPAELPLRQYGLAELAARASVNVGDAMGRLAKYAPLIHPALACELAVGVEEGRWVQRTPAHPRGVGRHVHELGLAFVVTHLRAGAGADLTPARVWFAHARPPELASLHAFFGTRALDFGAPDSGLVFAARDLAMPMREGDARLAATVEKLADAAVRAQPREVALRPRVATQLRALLPDRATVDEVAAALRMSPRTLQRRLEEEGTRFTDVLETVREEMARSLLAETELPLAEVSYRLGFADLATFSRAFKRWTGKPPGTWRRA